MGLKIATTSAIGWPYLRRGNRFTYELAVYLAGRGHEVHHITAKPGRINREKKQGDLLIKYRRLFGHPILSNLNIHFFETFVPTCFYSLFREKYDVVHCFLYPDAYAASLAKRFNGMALVPFLADGIPLYWPTRLGRSMFKGVVKRATRFHAPSEFTKQCLKEEFHVDAEIIPLPVNTEYFTPSAGKDISAPRILCTVALSVERKGVGLLVSAFEKLLEHIPNAVLQLSGHADEQSIKKLLQSVRPETRRAIEMRGVGPQTELRSLYREATITVLSSVNEPFGMVTLESLASGTPVVGTRSGAIPEIITDPDVGVLFNHSDGAEGLCVAMLRCIDLARDPGTPGRCRTFAGKYSWDAVGPKYEEMYYRLLNESRKRNE